MIFGSVTTKFGGSVPPVRSSSAVRKRSKRAQAAPLQLLAQRLDADADERRQRAVRQPRRDLVGRGLRVAVLFVVGAVAVAVLEVDAEVLDRLARQLVDDARVDAVGEARDRARSPSASVAASGACSLSARSASAPELLRRRRP